MPSPLVTFTSDSMMGPLRACMYEVIIAIYRNIGEDFSADSGLEFGIGTSWFREWGAGKNVLFDGPYIPVVYH